MTCVCAVIEEGNVFMGCDSLMTDSYLNQYNLSGLKIVSYPVSIRNHDTLLIGWSGEMAALNALMRFKAPSSELVSQGFARQYVYNDFSQALKQHFIDEKLVDERNRFTGVETSFIIGLKGKIFYMFRDFSAYEPNDAIGAIGSGGPHAMGALAALSRSTPENRIRKSIEIASKYDAQTGGPISVVNTRGY